MPFTSRRQARAAFGGHIPGFSKTRAKKWADKTDFEELPDRAPEEKGKPTLRTKSAAKYLDTAQIKDFFTKLAYSMNKPNQTAASDTKDVGSYPGKTTNNFLKPPGPAASSQVINPRKSLANVFKKTM